MVTKCTVENCPNQTNEGSFDGPICSPCWEFLARGKGVYSQAYRNAREKFIHWSAVEFYKVRFYAGIGDEFRERMMKEAWKDAIDMWNFNHPGDPG